MSCFGVRVGGDFAPDDAAIITWDESVGEER